MKLHCSVRVIHRLLPTTTNSSSKYQNAVISVGKVSKDSEVSLIVVTQSNKSGSRYKICGNVEKTFGQFTNEGKCTIRFKEPCHDLCITAESIPLKNFMLFIKKAWKGELENPPVIRKNVDLIPQCRSKSYKLHIKKKEDYPVLKGFPKTLHTLQITDCKLSKFDSRILKLNSLTVLCLSKNKLQIIPEELGCLHLQQLLLDSNDLQNERWIFLSGVISKTLTVLDISNNNIKILPSNLSRFNSLKVLKASKNLLTSIPFQICQLPQLQELDISCNNISALPGSIRRKFLKKLNILDVSGNELISVIQESDQYISRIALHKEVHSFVCSLLELAGQRTVDYRLPYNEEVIPQHLVRLLDNSRQCYCGKTTVTARELRRFITDAKSIASTFISSERQSSVPIIFYPCSSNRFPVNSVNN